jgi:hypothetical protein
MQNLPSNLTESELRAFQFGPEIRRVAQLHFSGSLDRALEHVEDARVQQHWRDVRSIRIEHRQAYIERLAEACGHGTEIVLTTLAEVQAKLAGSVDQVVTSAAFELAALLEDGLAEREDLAFHVFTVAGRDYIMRPAGGGLRVDTCTYEETDGRSPDGLPVTMPVGDSDA